MRVRTVLRELFTIDARTLALLRIGLGLSVLADVATRAPDLVGLYTDRGVFGRDLLLAMDGRGVLLSAHYWASAHPLLQGALFGLTAACAVALVVGWRTRLATLACWYLVASVQIRQPLGYMGGDSILRLLLFWGLFLPLAARFSIDAAQGRQTLRADRVVSGATVALLLQVCLIYWVTGLRKTGELWWSGQAIFYALHSEAWPTSLGVWLRGYPSLLEAMTYATLGLELLGPFLVFVPVYTSTFRMLAIAVFWAFHLALAATMNIGLFPLFSMVAWLAFVPPEVWARDGGREPTAPGYPGDWRSRIASATAAMLFVYVLVLLAEQVRVIPRVLPPAATGIGTALRLQQSWSMFAPDPATAAWRHVVRRTMADGSETTELAATRFRWTLYLARAGAPLPPDSPLSVSLRRFALSRCDGASTTGSPVERVAVLVHSRAIPFGADDRTSTRTAVDIRCPGSELARDLPPANCFRYGFRLFVPWSRPKSDAMTTFVHARAEIGES